MGEQKIFKGGSFLIAESIPKETFIPEDYTEEHRMIYDTTDKFVENDVLPVKDKLEAIDYDLARELMKKAGELGLLGVEIEEADGGLGLDKVTAALVAEASAKAGAFSVTMGAHAGIGTLPIVYYGTKEQKQKYLPKLATGEQIAAFALTEPTAGCDAFAVKTKAEMSEDKSHFVLNGTKQFISNGGFADIFVVLAKTGDKELTAFIVERGFGGVSSGEEEKKLGIKGSSTTQVILENVKVPKENQLGETGAGFKIVLNILNAGRFKLGAGCVGACKDVISKTVQYTSEREQFGQPINRFGLIMEKLSNMAIRTYVAESAVYRACGNIQQCVEEMGTSAEAVKEYAIECSILKVFCSEVLDYVVDEALQAYGGYGYTLEYPIEGAYRDARINRIFEGTNEINRLLIPGLLIKKGMKGELNLMAAVSAVQKEMSELPVLAEESGDLLEKEKKLLAGAKKGVLLISGAGMQKFGTKLEDEQELLGKVADCIMEIYVLESVMLRALKIAGEKGEKEAGPCIDIARVYAFEAASKMDAALKECACAIFEGDDLRILLTSIKRFMKYVPVNIKEIRRKIAKGLIDQGKYTLST